MSDQLSALKNLYDSYTSDPIFQEFRNRGATFIKGRGPLNPEIMFIGERPGKDEDSLGKPFVGFAGIELNYLLKGEDIDPESAFYTCLMKYHSPHHSSEALATSYDYVDKEISIVCPRFVALLGVPVVRMFYPDITEIADYNGKLLDGQFIPLNSPAAMIHTFGRRSIIRKGYKLLSKHLQSSRAS